MAGLEEAILQNGNGTTAEDEVRIVETTSRRHKFELNMEVPFFCMFFGLSLSGTVISNMLLQRACRLSLGYNETVCSQLLQPGSHDEDLENRVQAVVTVVSMCQGVLEGVFPAMLALSLGVWSERHGRKPLCTWPLFGIALTTILAAGYSLLPGLSPWWYVGTSLPFSLGGGGSTLFAGSFCHLTDITHESDRSFRLATLEASLFLGSILGSLSSRYAEAALGEHLLLLITASLCVVAYVYANLCVQESVPNPQPGGIKTIFDFSLVRSMAQTCFKRRQNYERAALLILVFANSLTLFIIYGTLNIDYLYTRQKLSWQLDQYAIYSAVNTSILVLGMILGVGILQKRLKISDLILSMISFVSCIAEVAFKSVATVTTSWLMYLGSGVSLLRGLNSPLIRSEISKRVSAHEVAKFFALMAALEAILPVLSPILYSMLYRWTLRTVPEAVYLMSIGFYGVCLALVGVAHYLFKIYSPPNYTQLES